MEPLEWLPYEKRYSYPGMMPLDKEIWERYIDNAPDAFIECAYNVAVGAGEPDMVANSPGAHPNLNRLYQRKIDVVARTAKGITIIEIGPRAATAKVGQVKGYALLFARDYTDTVPITPIVLTDVLMPDMDFIAKEAGVQVIVAPV